MSFEQALLSLAKKTFSGDMKQGFSIVPMNIQQLPPQAQALAQDVKAIEFVTAVSRIGVPEDVYKPCLFSRDNLMLCRYFLGLDKTRPPSQASPELAQFFFTLLYSGKLNQEAQVYVKDFERLLGSLLGQHVEKEVHSYLKEVEKLIREGRKIEAEQFAENLMRRIDETISRFSRIFPEDFVRKTMSGMIRGVSQAGLSQDLANALVRGVETKSPEELKKAVKEAVAKTEMKIGRGVETTSEQEFVKRVGERLAKAVHSS